MESIDNLDVGLSAKLIPCNDYACFEYRGAISEKLGEYFQKIYHEWLPSSGYKMAAPYDLERYDERFLGPENEDSVMEMLLPVRKD